MKITDKHRFILNKVRLMSTSAKHLHGASFGDLGGTDLAIVRAVRALTKAGYLETFRTPPCERESPAGMISYRADGHILFRVGPKGADYMVKKVFEEETSKTIEERVAARLKGINPEYIRRSKPSACLRRGWTDELAAHVTMLG